MPSSPRRSIILMPHKTTPAHGADTPAKRAVKLASACREAGLDNYDAGWISGYMYATGVDALPISQWRQTVAAHIADIFHDNELLRSVGVDPRDVGPGSDYVAVGSHETRTKELATLIRAAGVDDHKVDIERYLRSWRIFDAPRDVWDSEVAKLIHGVRCDGAVIWI